MTISVDELLTTTRSVRRRLDLSRPVDRELVAACLRLAIQAPNGGNRQDWRFLVVDDPATMRRLAEYYRTAALPYLAVTPAESTIVSSARFLAEHLHEVPVVVLACLLGRCDGAPAPRQSSFFGSIYPAVWSFMLAARSHGLGTALTTTHLAYEREVAELLGIPCDSVTQVALLVVGHTRGTRFRPAVRRPLGEVVYWNRWPEDQA
jgi:nitroreductase